MGPYWLSSRSHLKGGPVARSAGNEYGLLGHRLSPIYLGNFRISSTILRGLILTPRRLRGQCLGHGTCRTCPGCRGLNRPRSSVERHGSLRRQQGQPPASRDWAIADRRSATAQRRAPRSRGERGAHRARPERARGTTRPPARGERARGGGGFRPSCRESEGARGARRSAPPSQGKRAPCAEGLSTVVAPACSTGAREDPGSGSVRVGAVQGCGWRGPPRAGPGGVCVCVEGGLQVQGLSDARAAVKRPMFNEERERWRGLGGRHLSLRRIDGEVLPEMRTGRWGRGGGGRGFQGRGGAGRAQILSGGRSHARPTRQTHFLDPSTAIFMSSITRRRHTAFC